MHPKTLGNISATERAAQRLSTWAGPLDAFTLVEMVAGLAIAALVVMIGFYGVQLLQKQHALFIKRTDEALEYRNLQSILSNDFSNADWVLLENDSTIRCHLPTQSLVYRFSHGFAVRELYLETPLVDTFFAQAHLKEASMQGKLTVAGLIDRCRFDLHPFGEIMCFETQKIYSAEDLIQFEKEHEH